MKKAGLMVLFLLALSSFVFAGGQLYPQVGVFGGVKIYEDGGCRHYGLFSGELEALLSSTEKGKIHYDHFRKNAFWGAVFNLIGAAAIVTDVWCYINNAEAAKANGGLFYGTLAGGAVISGIGTHMVRNASNEFFLAVKEYNTSIKGDKKAHTETEVLAGVNIGF